MTGQVTFITFPTQKTGASQEKKWGFRLLQGNGSCLNLTYASKTEATRAFHTLAAVPGTHKVTKKLLFAIMKAMQQAVAQETRSKKKSLSHTPRET